ncbi:MAG TPA: BREX system P-loop protein BrxC, partial [Clostridiales bacterium]|nr:BREX system P-loop protein BrxC [Clostridiales bacterium]
VSNELDTVLRVAKKCVPALDTEALKATLLNPDSYHIDTRKFANEVKNFLALKNENYRFVFLVDEVSQFVNTNSEVLLDLQSVIENLSLTCNRQVWVTCTAQQTIDSVIADTGITSGDDRYGKIMGRFETRVSMESTDPAYITQKRILEKKPTAELELKKLFRENKDAILNQFNMGHEL